MNRRLLYIEDNPSNLLLVRRIMQAMSIDMLEAIDGESGVELALREHPDLLLVDLDLPGIDGIEVIRRIKANPTVRHVPIIVLTSHGDTENERRANAVGCSAFLRKPADIRQIRATISRFIN